jgi:hypothetical protein
MEVEVEVVVVSATLLHGRSTLLEEGGDKGMMANWLRTFGGGLFQGAASAKKVSTKEWTKLSRSRGPILMMGNDGLPTTEDSDSLEIRNCRSGNPNKVLQIIL